MIISLTLFIINLIIILEDVITKSIRNIWLIIYLIIAVMLRADVLFEALVGGLIGLTFFLIAYFISKQGIGEADLIIIFIFGIISGPMLILRLIMFSSILSLPIVFYLFIRKKERRYEIPYAPFLIIALYIVNKSILFNSGSFQFS